MKKRKLNLAKWCAAACLALPLIVFGAIAVYAAYTGPLNRVKTTTTTTWERRRCYYEATYDPAGPGLYGCHYTGYVGPTDTCPSTSSSYIQGIFNAVACGWSPPLASTLSCKTVSCSITLSVSSGSCNPSDDGCTSVSHTVTTDLPWASVSGATHCSSDGDDGWCTGAATLDLSGAEPLSGYSITSIESNLGVLCSSAACAWTFPEGATDLSVWANSTYGDSSPMLTLPTVKVDSVPPELTVTLPAKPASGWFSSAPVTASVSATDAISGIAFISINGGGDTFTATADGIYSLSAIAHDNAGNTATASATIQLDTTPPELTVSLPPANGLNGWNTSSVTVSASADDALSGLASVQFSDDGGSFQSGSTVEISEDGGHTVTFQATDNAGNTSTQSVAVQMDMLAPESAFVSPAEGSTITVRGSLVMSGVTTDATSGPAGAEISLDDGSTWQALTLEAGGTWSYRWDTTRVSNGPHVVRVRAADLAGNQEHTAQITVVVSNDPPRVSLPASWRVWELVQVTIQAGSSPLAGAAITVCDPSGQQPDQVFRFGPGDLPSEFRWNGRFGDGSAAPSGTYPVMLAAWDALGNSNQAVGEVTVPYPTPTPSPMIASTDTPVAPVSRAVAPAATEVAATPLPTPTPTPTSTPQPEEPAPITWPAAFAGSLVLLFLSLSLLDSRPAAWRRLARTKS